ncbi:hypothetical protein VTJ04DRAFT_9033 [Mycothermus thermophilus]|uniref:uncharacterized protein n=1 Tax=Humicola insolens TaxID=85995 RepID=UPI003743A79D
MLRYIHGPSPALCSLLLALLVPSKETSQSGSSLTGPDYILTIITNMSIHPSPYHIHPSVHAPSQQIPPTSHTSARTPNQSNPVEFNPIQASVMPSSSKRPGSALLLSSCVSQQTFHHKCDKIRKSPDASPCQIQCQQPVIESFPAGKMIVSYPKHK